MGSAKGDELVGARRCAPGGDVPASGFLPIPRASRDPWRDEGPVADATGAFVNYRGEWRWRESNPRPSVAIRVFSGRSLLCFSQPRQSRRQAADGLSHCVMSCVTP